MPRTARSTPAGYVYHALNRAAASRTLFRKARDYEAFLRILDEALARHPTRLLAYCVMPTHWHLVLWPRTDRELSDFLRWLTLTHSVRWQAHYRCTGSGHVYQNRFKAFPVEEDPHYFTLIRYVERNAQRAGLVERAGQWRWSSLFLRGVDGQLVERLSAGPLSLPTNWAELVERPQTEAELEAVRRSVMRSRPFGSDVWAKEVSSRLGLEWTMRGRGRPRKPRPESEGV